MERVERVGKKPAAALFKFHFTNCQRALSASTSASASTIRRRERRREREGRETAKGERARADAPLGRPEGNTGQVDGNVPSLLVIFPFYAFHSFVSFRSCQLRVRTRKAETE